jgi:hypothetical protein
MIGLGIRQPESQEPLRFLPRTHLQVKLAEIRLGDMGRRKLELLGQGNRFTIVSRSGPELSAMLAEVAKENEDRDHPCPLCRPLSQRPGPEKQQVCLILAAETHQHLGSINQLRRGDTVIWARNKLSLCTVESEQRPPWTPEQPVEVAKVHKGARRKLVVVELPGDA